jgi:CHAT domain-containing protein
LRERKTALLEYYVGSDFVLVCLVTGDSVHIEQLRGPADVGPVSGDFMELLRSFDNIYQGWRRGANDRAAREVTASLDDNLAKTQAALAKLAELVLGPMAERLDAAEPLCVVPHGPLYSLPIHALPLKNGDPLIARRPVFYSMSAAALCLQIERNKKTAPTPADQWNALIAAKHSFSEYGKDPQGQPTLPPLNTISEATRVAALFDQKTVLTDYEDDQGDKPSAAPPTKAAVKQALRQRRDFVLFSTHACFGTARDTFADTDDPLDSFVVLNKGGGEDGLLSLEEIIDLNLAGSVVYLSACQTGQAGGLVGGSSTYDEFVSLAAGFSLAGSSAVIASMRPVWDNSSKKISIEFARLLREGPPRAEALRAALLKIREYKGEFWNHPAHWAAFILIGDGT